MQVRAETVARAADMADKLVLRALRARRDLALLMAALAGEAMLAGEQLGAHLALLLRPHGDDLRLRVHPRAHDLRPVPSRMHLVAGGTHPRGNVLVLLRD